MKNKQDKQDKQNNENEKEQKQPGGKVAMGASTVIINEGTGI